MNGFIIFLFAMVAGYTFLRVAPKTYLVLIIGLAIWAAGTLSLIGGILDLLGYQIIIR